jgi:hypothetical protein
MNDIGGSMDDAAIQELVTRLSRRGRGGDLVIERAAILAEGSECEAVESCLLARGGRAEMPAARTGRGLYAERESARGGGGPQTAQRYVLPAGTL